jgi:hypothetical protein
MWPRVAEAMMAEGDAASHVKRALAVWHSSDARDQSLVGCARVGLPLALAARAALF